MHVALRDGYRMFVEEVGAGFPLIVLHGGPGLDHTMFRPWLDVLGDEYRLLYVDQRGQGRSDRVDPASLSVEVFARDVDLLADALELESYALLGHSFGAIVTTWHAIELGTAAAYVISGGGDSSERLLDDVGASLAALPDEQRDAITESWEQEKSVETEEAFAELMRVQLPFHFAGTPPEDFGEDAVYSPDVLRHFANVGYGDFDYTEQLGRIDRPTLVVVGERDRTTTPRAARVLNGGIRGSRLHVVRGAGHLCYAEASEDYVSAVRRFLNDAVAAVSRA